MNLTLVKELLAIYRVEDGKPLNLSKLEIVCAKLKKIDKVKNLQMASVCWSLLVQLNRHQTATFSSIDVLYLTAKVILYTTKVIEAAQTDLNMSELDLDKILANLLSKLSEGIKVELSSEDKRAGQIIDLFQFVFDRISKHSNPCFVTDLRRISIADMVSINELFVDIKFVDLTPAQFKNDPVLIQLTIVALESLCRTILAFGEGPIEKLTEVLMSFHSEFLIFNLESGNKIISHFVSSICKSEFWNHLEWKFWSFLSSHQIYQAYLHFFKRRCHLTLSAPESFVLQNLSMKIIAPILESKQHIDVILKALQSYSQPYDDEIIGACLSIINQDISASYITLLQNVISHALSRKISDSGLKSVLSSLDFMRNNLLVLFRIDLMGSFYISLDKCLMDIELPIKFYVSWTSSVLKTVFDNKTNLSRVQDISKTCISGLLKCFDHLCEEMKSKVRRIVFQTLSIANDRQLLIEATNQFEDSIEIVLEHSCFNLSSEYFNELSHITFTRPFSEHLLLSWSKVLISQVQVNISAFPFDNAYYGHSLAKLLSFQVFDHVKISHYLDLIYTRMRQISCKEDSMMLSKHLIHLKFPRIQRPVDTDFRFKNSLINEVLNVLSSFIKSSELDLKNVSIENAIMDDPLEFELIEYTLNYLMINAKRSDYECILVALKGSIELADRMYQLFFGENYVSTTESMVVESIHSVYKLGKLEETLKYGYEILKKYTTKIGPDHTFDAVEVNVYLYRLSTSSNNYAEARYFVKQLFQLVESSKSDTLKFYYENIKVEFDILKGAASHQTLYSKCETILKSQNYQPFTHSYKMLIELDLFRKQIKDLFISTKGFQIACNSIKITELDAIAQIRLSDYLSKTIEHLKMAQKAKMYYFVGEWAKISVLLTFSLSQFENNSLSTPIKLFELFELSRNPNFEGGIVNLSAVSGSIGLLFDECLSIFWILTVSFDAKLILYKLNFDNETVNISQNITKIHEICSQNTESLRNTKEIALDSFKKAQWWKLRRALDAELTSVCSSINDYLFSDLSEALIPSGDSRHLEFHKQLYDLVSEFSHEKIHLTEEFSRQLMNWGTFPSRSKIELLIKMIRSSCSSYRNAPIFTEETDFLLVKIRKCFHSCSSDFIYSGLHIKLLIHKDLNIVPFESFSLFSRCTFKRIPFITPTPSRSVKQCPTNSILKKVYYIVNPSGDLVQTQERFESIFKEQPNWEGIIGRKPSPDEFFKGICGIFQLFIYFGHSGGENYAPLKELKKKMTGIAASALLVGCSSGKIKPNGIFLAESSIFYYLESKSPFVLANLWDVTDKDIDIYIKGVLEESDLILPDNSKELNIQTTANEQTIIEKAQQSRQKCFLKALNGYAPIVYGLI